ncbi:MAG: restriction endonuclease subunit S [Beijerinckiaceae bacterium]
MSAKTKSVRHSGESRNPAPLSGEGQAVALAVNEGPVTPYLAKPQQPRHSRAGGNPEWVPLEQICEIIQGQSPPGSTYNADGIGLPFFQGKAEFGELYPTPAKWCTEPTKIARKDDVLISIWAPVGPTNICPMEACIGRGLAALRPNNGTSSKYVLYAMRSTGSVLADKATGTTFAAVSGKQLRAHLVPFVPTNEQDRIVAELETQLTRLDSTVTALKRVQANLKRYRASVLKAACEGRLVPTEAEIARREGRAYESSAAASRMAYAPKLVEGWTFTTVGKLAERVQFGSSAKTSEDDDGIPVLRMGNIIGGSLDSSELKYLPADHSEFPELLLKPGDLLFNRTNSAELVGKTAMYAGRPDPCSFASYPIRVRLSNQCLPQFLAFYINSVFGRAWIKTVVNQQVGQANVNGTKLKALVVPLPPLAEQHRIVAEVERRLSVIEELEATISANLKRAEGLRQSVLRVAFTMRS